MHSSATGSAPSGMPSSEATAAGSKMDTQPMPSPSARAASHRFWMAQAVEAKSICGIVRRPNTWRSRPSASATTHTSAASITPSTFRRMNSSSRSPRARAVSTRSCSTRACSSARKAREATRTKRQGCMKPTLGPWCAAVSRRRITSGATLPPAKWRISRRSKMARYTASRSSGEKA